MFVKALISDPIQSRTRRYLALTAALLLAAMVPAHAEDEIDAEQPLFYPLPPDRPRLQLLAKFTTVLDLSSAKNKGFRDFVFGGEDNEAELVGKPYGLDIYDGAIYVVDIRGNGYGVWDVANQKSRFVRPSGAGALKKPINIAIDDDGTRFITDTMREQVVVYDAQDRFLRAFGEPGQFRPADVAIVEDRIFVSDVMHHKIHVLDKNSGETLFTFGESGSEPGSLHFPTSLAVGDDGTIYVTNTTNFRIDQFSLDGEFIRSIGAMGVSAGSFTRPKGIALDRQQRLYVADAAFENIQVFAPEGGALMRFGAPGSGRGNINMPAAIKIDYENVPHFQKYVDPNFNIEYLVVVASQFGVNKVLVFGFGSLRE